MTTNKFILKHFLRSEPDIFNEPKYELLRRTNAKLGLWEFTALAFNLFMLLMFIYLGTTNYNGFGDYQIYLRASKGEFSAVENNYEWGYYYAYWLLPFVRLLSYLPYRVGILIWGSMNLLGLFFGARVFGNKSSLVLLTYQSLSVLFIGQISGIIVGGLGLLWYSLRTERWFLASVGIMIASMKYHVGGLVWIALLFLVDKPMRRKIQVLLVCGLLFGLSLAVYSNWPLEVFERIQQAPPSEQSNIALWTWLGPAVLLLWVPPLLLPLTKQHRLIALISTLSIAIPYFQQHDLLILYVFPVGLLASLGNLGFSLFFLDFAWIKLLAIVPLLAYGFVIVPAFSKLLKERFA